MTRTLGTASRRLYTLTVFLFDGPVTRAFARRNRIVSRTIQIRGNQTLAQLHQAIFRAFDRYEQHFYEFQMGGKGPLDPKARRYVLPGAFEVQKADPDQRPAGMVTQTPIGALGLRRRQAFGYWFDFGEDWWHQINVVTIKHQAPPGRYPIIIKRVGDSPPQYVDWEKEDEGH